MNGQSEKARQLSMYAEFTISNNANGITLPVVRDEQDGNLVCMSYTWTANPTRGTLNTSNNPKNTTQDESNASYSFQRGNLFFTSTPANRHFVERNRLSTSVQDSGYNSDPPYGGSNSRQNTQYLPENKRCRTTCSITLSTDINIDGNKISNNQKTRCHRCKQNQSPPRTSDCKERHKTCHEHKDLCFCRSETKNKPFSSTSVNCEECEGGWTQKIQKKENTFSTHFCTKVLEKKAGYNTKDMMTQTVETREKSTSPFKEIQELNKENRSASELSVLNKNTGTNVVQRRKKSPNFRQNLGFSQVDNTQSNRNLSRSPDINFDKLFKKKQNTTEDSSRQRTVHIDVYCTASEDDSDSSTTIFDSDEEMKHTVFSSANSKVTHRRAGKSEIPHSLKLFNKDNILPSSLDREKNEDNDCFSDDNWSTAYPSALNSYSTINDFETHLSSVVSSSTLSSSGYCFPGDYNSASNLSCKSSLSDSECVIQRKIHGNNMECSHSSKFNKDSSFVGKFIPCRNSFEYNDSFDKERIKRMELMWNEKLKHKIYKNGSQKFDNYLNNKLKDKTESNTFEDVSENSKLNYIKNEDKKSINLKRGYTVNKESKNKEIVKSKDNYVISSDMCTNYPVLYNYSFKKPFTNVSGNSSERFSKAQKFGTVIDVIKKPGHHVGPAKNPDCFCAHCKNFYTSNSQNRTFSNTPFNEELQHFKFNSINKKIYYSDF